MTKWLLLGALGVAFLIGGALLITSGTSAPLGQISGVVGVVLILVCVLAFPLAVRWALLRTKGRAVLFGVGAVGRLVVGGILAVVAVAVVLYMTA